MRRISSLAVYTPLIFFAETKGIIMEKSSEGPKTSDHFLRELIEKVRFYDSKHGVFSESRKEMLEAADEAEVFLNRDPEESTE